MAQNPELALWRAVLIAGLQDDARRGEDAGDWVGSDDFAQVCHLAGLDPDGVVRSYRPETHQIRRGRAAKANVNLSLNASDSSWRV